MPNPAKMDRRITLQVKTTTQNDYGEPIVTWTTYARIWAEKKDMKGLEKFIAQQVRAEIDTRFVIRYRDDVSLTDRLTFESRDYDIQQVIEIGRRESLEIIAKARVE